MSRAIWPPSRSRTKNMPRPPRFQLGKEKLVAQVGGVGQGEADGPAAGIDSARAHKPERPRRRVACGDAIARRVVALPLEFQMEPHDVFAGSGIVDHFRTLHDAPALDVASGLPAHRQHKAAASPVQQIL